MNRLTRLLVKIYPASWRARYGDEFDALLEDVGPSFRTAWNVFTGASAMQIRSWNVGWMIVISAIFGAAVLGALLVAFPKQYSSTAVLTVGGESGSRLSQNAIDGINTIAESVESRATLTGVIVKHNLYRAERTRMTMEDVIDRMRKNILVRPLADNRSFAVDFVGSEPAVAQGVASDLAGLFISGNLRNGGLITLQMTEMASLPERSSRHTGALAAVSAASGLVMLGVLALWRRRAVRQA